MWKIHQACYTYHSKARFLFKFKYSKTKLIYSPASKASREVANLTESKTPHTPVYGVIEFVCLLQFLTWNISGLAIILFIIYRNKLKLISRKFAILSAWAIFVSLFLPFFDKKSPFLTSLLSLWAFIFVVVSKSVNGTEKDCSSQTIAT